MQRTFPIATNYLEGWTSCCDAAVTFDEHGTYCCKACWNAVEPIRLSGSTGDELGRIISEVIAGTLPADEGVSCQHALLARAS